MERITRQQVSIELKEYKARITDCLLAVFMLTANEAWGIGEARMAKGMDLYAENLSIASEYIDMGVNEEILLNRLKQRGLDKLYNYIVRGGEKPC